MAKHLPSVIWGFWRSPQPRKFGRILRTAYVRTFTKNHLEIVLIPHGARDTDKTTSLLHDQSALDIVLTRSEAKLLAKRITQCLEDTK